MIRLGLCCTFHREPIAFRTTTATALLRLPRPQGLRKLANLALENAASLRRALGYCAAHGIGAFRVNSQILPLKTHPQAGYAVEDLPQADAIVSAFQACGETARALGIRLSFHPDQFILLSARDEAIVAASVRELVYQAEVAEWVNADVINLHAGGAYGDKPAALRRLAGVIETLPAAVRKRLTLENDDRTYTPRDLLPLCLAAGVPLVYDAHHHRCLPDGLSVEEATERARETWTREPLVHLSSPRDGYASKRPGPHHDFIRPADLPAVWRTMDLTLEVEAKAKEVAIAQLQRDLRRLRVPLWQAPGATEKRNTT